jgi:DNA polymerase V
VQQALFDPIDRKKQAALIEAIDQINKKNGHDTVRVAVQGTNIRFGLKREYISHHYTTDIDDVLKAKL